jgi:methionyl-tRNA synthetase
LKKILITSALPYANGYLHLGHLAGAYLPADIFARYSRLSGKQVLYVCGSDEHGVAITISAEKEKTTPKDIIDKYHTANKDAFEKFGMSFDIYSRTSIESHHKIAKEFFADFLEKGLLIEKEEEQFYDEKAKMFLPDRYVEGTCPHCGYDKARGDQCDNCSAYYNQIELINPKSIVTGDIPVVKKTTHWYFKFQELQDFLENYIESHKNDWKDNVLQQSRSWLKLGLTERAITRDLDWGVKIDDIPGLDKQKSQGKVLYVWFDAVLGYISATKEWAKQQFNNEEAFADWWQNNETDYFAFIGKDNIVFHTLIFPAMLHSKGGYILPKNVPANEFLNLEGQKFSKSRNWSIDLQDYFNDFKEETATDSLRFALLMNLPETRDADFTWKDFQTRNNSELAAIFGNFVNRTTQFIAKNFDSKVPQISDEFINDWTKVISFLDDNFSDNIDNAQIPENFVNTLNLNDISLIISLWQGIEKSKALLEKFKIREAYLEIMNIARSSNKYFNDEAPWKSIKVSPELAAKTLFACSQLIYSLSILFAPAIPFAAAKLQSSLNFQPYVGNATNAKQIDNFWDKAQFPNLKSGVELKIQGVLFPLIDDKVVQEQIEKLGKININQQSENVPDNFNVKFISIDDFKKIKLTTAKVVEAEKIAKSDKLLKLQIEISGQKRQLIAGIAKYYTPEQMLNKTIVVVENLQPVKLFGNLSEGMLLAAKTPDGRLSLLTVEENDFPTGAEIS